MRTKNNKANKKRPTAITKWLRESGLENDATALACWESMADEGLGKLQQRAMRLVGEVIRLRKGQEELRRLRAEEAEFYQRELATARRENLGRIQSNLLQTMQSMMATLEGNSRSVHALAEPVGELLVHLRNEMDKR